MGKLNLSGKQVEKQILKRKNNRPDYFEAWLTRAINNAELMPHVV